MDVAPNEDQSLRSEQPGHEPAMLDDAPETAPADTPPNDPAPNDPAPNDPATESLDTPGVMLHGGPEDDQGSAGDPTDPERPAVPPTGNRSTRGFSMLRLSFARPRVAAVISLLLVLLLAAVVLGSLGVQRWGTFALTGVGAGSATSPSATVRPTATGTLVPTLAPTATPDPMLAWNRQMGCADGHPASAAQVVFGTKDYATGGAAPREVALTFDDGPTPYTSPPILDYLEQSHTPATFFVLGLYARSWPYLVQREWKDGFAIGVHSWDHPVMTIVSDAQMAHQFGDTVVAIHAAIGQDACIWFWRAPYGSFNSRVISTAQHYGLTTIQWNADPADWSRPGVDVIVSRVLAQAHPGSIVVMHDGPARREQTAAALPQIVAGLRARGLTPVTLPQLLADSHYPGVALFPTRPPTNENALPVGSLPPAPIGPVPIVPDGGNSGE